MLLRDMSSYYFIRNLFLPGKRVSFTHLYCETPILKANNLKVTIGVAELVSCNETR